MSGFFEKLAAAAGNTPVLCGEELKTYTTFRIGGPARYFLSPEEGETAVEIIDDPKAANAGSEHLSIGFQTDDVLKKREELAAKGLEVSPVIRPNPQVQFFFVKDPAGLSVQFM